MQTFESVLLTPLSLFPPPPLETLEPLEGGQWPMCCVPQPAPTVPCVACAASAARGPFGGLSSPTFLPAVWCCAVLCSVLCCAVCLGRIACCEPAREPFATDKSFLRNENVASV